MYFYFKYIVYEKCIKKKKKEKEIQIYRDIRDEDIVRRDI